jgi:bacteriochlorophyllide a dehydrogenase
MKITAAILDAPFEVRLAEIAAQDPGPEDVVIGTEYSFISNGTERHLHRQEFPDKPAPFPKVSGYQCVGRVEWAGSAVNDLAVGDRVFTRSNRVVDMDNPLGGVHAYTIVTAATEVIRLPAEVDPVEASALVVAQVGYNAASRMPQSDLAEALVIGDGLIGQFTAQALCTRGFRVLLAGRHEYRLEMAKAAVSAIETVNTTTESLEDGLQRFSGNRIESVLDCVANPLTLEQGIELIAPFGHLAVVGWQGGGQSLNVHQAFGKECTVHFPAGSNRERLMATLDLIRVGKMCVNPLITHRFNAKDFAEACRLLDSVDTDYLGIVVDWLSEDD